MDPLDTKTHWKINGRMSSALSQLHTLYPMVFGTTSAPDEDDESDDDMGRQDEDIPKMALRHAGRLPRV